MSLYSSPPSSRSTDLFTPPHVLPPFSSSSFRSPCLSLPPPSSPFPHLFHHSSAPFLSSCPSFFLSLCYSLLFPLLTLLLRPSFFSLSLPPALSSFLPFCPRLSVTLYLCISVSLSVHAPYFPVSFRRISFVPFLLLLPPVLSPCFPASSYLPSFVSLAPESTQSSVVRCPIIVACHMHRLYL